MTWIKAITIVAAVAGAMIGSRRNSSTIKKQEPPKFSGRLKDYPKFKRQWDNMIDENRITTPQHASVSAGSMASCVSVECFFSIPKYISRKVE